MMIIVILFLFTMVSFLVIFDTKYLKKGSIFLFWVISIGLIVFAGFRDGSKVKDYENYVDLFINPDALIEPSFNIISQLVKFVFSGRILVLFFIYAALGVCTKALAIRSITPFIFASILVYMSNFFILHELTAMRAGVASGFLLLSIKPLRERNLLMFLVLATCAILFHYSAIVILPLWFLDCEKPRKLLLLSAVPIGLCLYFLKINLLFTIPIPGIQEKMLIYQGLYDSGAEGFAKINVLNALFILRCGLFYFLLAHYTLLIDSNKYTVLLMKIYAISLFLLPALATMPVLAFRLNELLGVVEIVLVPMIIYIFKDKIFSRLLLIGYASAVIGFNIFYGKYIIF
ncbi:hypothetical protein ACVWYG_003474 [Pedobacter sp. UYEF25]